MTKSTITRERLEKIKSWRETYGTGSNVMLPAEEAEELARMALAEMDSEPVILYRERNPYNGLTTGWQELTENEFSFLKENAGENAEFITLYRHAQPAPERDQVRREHAEWSQVTFGNVGPVGPLKHLSKEALEAAAEPDDLSEWADMQFLLWDAQRRAGITDEQITQAMIEKLAVNKQREWPAPKDGEPRLHIKERPAQVIPDGYAMVPKEPTEEMVKKMRYHVGGYDRNIKDGYKAMLAAAPQLPGSEPAAVPDRWIPVSERMPETDGNYWGWWSESKRQGPAWFIKSELQAQFQSHEITHWMPLPAAPQEDKK